MSHKLLARQLKRSLGIDSEESLASMLESLNLLAQTTDQKTARALTGMGEFLSRVDESYVQADRDLDLRSRSLEQSSAELTQINETLRHETIKQASILETLRATANHMLETSGMAQIDAGDTNLEIVTALMAQLVQEHEVSRQRLKDALLDLNSQQRAFDEHAIVSLTDLSGNIIYANDKFCEISQYTHADLLGKNHRILKSGLHPDALYHEMWQTIASGKIWHGEVCNRARDGSLYWVAATIVPYLDENGLPYQYISIRTDITQIKQMEEELRQAMHKAEAGSRAKSDFLATMSHEIRTPMNGIIGMTELALDTDLDQEQREYIELVKTSANSLLTIINDILDFSKIEAGKLDIETIDFRLRDTLADIARMMTVRAEEKNLELVYEVAPDVPETLSGDPGRLRQILVNLIGNAIKFTERGVLALHVTQLNQSGQSVELQFSVEDGGIGIPQDKLRTIFDAFSQADSSTTRKYGGTGLGLAITSRLVALMGGRIWVDSTPGIGSTFHFTARCAITDPAPEAPLGAFNLKGVPVLVVDDNPVNCRYLSDLLLRWQAVPSVAQDGSSALAAVFKASHEGRPFPLILLDAMMPGMDGFEVAASLHKDPISSNHTVMMISSAGLRGDAERCRKLGIKAYLTKPISPNELLAAIENLLGKTGLAFAPLLTRHQLGVPPGTQPGTRSAGMDILLAEDNLINQKLAITLLEKWGHKITVANNGLEAIAAMRDKPFDLVLMDMQMPEMDGLEATREIRQMEIQHGTARTPIIAMTANAMQEDRDRCLEAGMDEHLAKPISSLKLADMLAGVTPRVAEISATTANSDTSFDYAAALASVDQEILQIIGHLFPAECAAMLGLLRQAQTMRDKETLIRTSHTLRGLFGNFAAKPAQKIAHQLEQAALADNFSAIPELLAGLEVEASLLLPLLEKIPPAT